MPIVDDENAIRELSLYISKTSVSNGIRRWAAVNSDTNWDLSGERMSKELYEKMILYIKNKVPPPEAFKSRICSKYWCGGLPYLSVAHYPDMDGWAVPGQATDIYIDGDQLKAKGMFFDNPFGEESYKSIKEDEISEYDDKIRISISFLDLAHRHGADGIIYRRMQDKFPCEDCLSGKGDKIYLDGYLVHLALTRVPVNPRTEMTVEKSMGKKIVTKKDDAESIIGDELAEKLDEKAKTEKSDAIVEMSTAEEVEKSDTPVVEEACSSDKKKKDEDMEDDEPKEEKPKKKSEALDVDDIAMQVAKILAEKSTSIVVEDAPKQNVQVQKSPLDMDVDELYTSINAAVVHSGSLEEKFGVVNASLQKLGKTIEQIVKSSVENAQEETTPSTDTKLILEQLSKVVERVDTVANKVALLEQSAAVPQPQKQRIPAPRSISPDMMKSIVAKADAEKPKPGSVASIARQSVGLRE